MPLLLLLLLAGRFWESKPPAEWNDEEVRRMFLDSPWAARAHASTNAPDAVATLASAAPMRMAEAEARRRFNKPGAQDDPLHEDYEAFLKENSGKVIVLAVTMTDPNAFSEKAEVSSMEQTCTLKVGRRKWKISGHFPPSTSDRFLRLVFPRDISATDKELLFEIYVPGLAMPYRTVQFKLKDLEYQGKPEF